MTNFPGPFTVEIFYTVDGLEHKQELNCKVQGSVTPGQDPVSIDILQRDGTTLTLASAVSAYVDVIKTRFDGTTTFDRYDFWEYTPLTNVRKYIASGNIGVTGTSTATRRKAGQDTYTFRTQEGGIMRLIQMESVTNDDSQKRLSELGGTQLAIVSYITDATGWILARDTSYPIAFLRVSNTQNERTYRERFRNN